MTRTQLILEPWQLEALRSTAEREGGSISSVVRRILTEALGGGGGRGPRLADIEGAFRDPGFSGREHDAALYGQADTRTEAVAARDPGATPHGKRPARARPSRPASKSPRPRARKRS